MFEAEKPGFKTQGETSFNIRTHTSFEWDRTRCPEEYVPSVVMPDNVFMSNLHKSKRYNAIDMFKDTSRYLDDIFTINKPEFEKHIPDIYPMELQLNKADTSEKRIFFP